jgi:predicted homoserine dehydrogenase-like protein
VEVVSSLERDGSEVADDLRWGVYVTFRGEGSPIPGWFRAYGLAIDGNGRYAALYRPYHLIGLEASVSVLSAGLLGEPTGAPCSWRADVVAVAKRDLEAGERLDGEGGSTVYGALVPARRSRAEALLPVALANGVRLRRRVASGERLALLDVEALPPSPALELRSELEALPDDLLGKA